MHCSWNASDAENTKRSVSFQSGELLFLLLIGHEQAAAFVVKAQDRPR